MVDAFFDDTPRKKHTPSNVSGCENACNLDFLLMRWHLLQSSIAAQNYSIERCVFGLNRWTLFYFFVKFHSQFLVPSVKELVSTKTAPTETTKAGSSTGKNSSKLNVNLITVKLEATVAKTKRNGKNEPTKYWVYKTQKLMLSSNFLWKILFSSNITLRLADRESVLSPCIFAFASSLILLWRCAMKTDTIEPFMPYSLIVCCCF